jgi:pimeloyl-ACP methyl ester carboxylesterase
MAEAPAPPPAPDAPLTRVPHIAPQHLAKLRRLFAVLQAISPSLAARLAFHMFLRTFRRPVTPEDRAVLDRARRHQLMAGPDPMTVYEWGDGPRTVVILHGWGSGAARFTRMAQALQQRGWRVLVPDAPGHGASPGRSSSLPQFMRGLDAIVARFGPPQALVGHSLGALGIALRHAGGPPDWAQQLQSVALISMPSGAAFLVDVFVHSLGIRQAARERMIRLFEKRFSARVEDFSALPGAARIRARLLVVHDRGDDIIPWSHSEAVLRAVPRATLLTTQEQGHSLLTRDATTIRAVVDFLEANAAD